MVIPISASKAQPPNFNIDNTLRGEADVQTKMKSTIAYNFLSAVSYSSKRR